MTTRRWHRPRPFAILLTLLGVTAFAGLGFWQLERAAQKERLLAAYANASQAPFEDFAAVRDRADVLHYPHVHIAGSFDRQHGYLLDEQMHDGRLGVHALAVFAVAGDDRGLLVDRGWLAWNHAPGRPPVLPPLAQGSTTINGIYTPYPGGGLRLGGNALAKQTEWPKLTLHIDPAELAADVGKPLLPGMLRLDADPASGFVREWTPNVMPPDRHRAYALQWFAFALAALGAFIAVHWRKVEM
jgi:surfeit locus 1 family protein